VGTYYPVQIAKHAFAAGGSPISFAVPLIKTDGTGAAILDGVGNPIPQPAIAGSRIVVTGVGGAQMTIKFTNSSGAAFTKRPSALDAIEVAVLDAVAAGGETQLWVTLNGDENYTLAIRQTDLGAYIGGSSNGTGNTANGSNDFEAIVSTAVTATGPAAIVSAFGWQGSTAYDETTRFRSHGPLGQLDVSFGHQPGSGTKYIGAGGVADVDTSHSYPAQLTAGQYKATSVWVQAGTVYAAQAMYAAGPTPLATLSTNATVRENSMPGTVNGNWFLGTNNNSGTIAGYTDSQSYQPGDTVHWKADTASADAFRVELYRLGHYGWESFGARNVTGNQGGYLTGTGVAQSAPVVDPVLGSASCAAWTSNASWTIPADAAPGWYFYILRRTGDTSKVCGGWFIVRPASVAGKVVVVVPDVTYQAYNIWGATSNNGSRAGGGWSSTGRSLYTSGATTTDVFAARAYAVDFDRPWGTPAMQPNTSPWDSDFGFAGWLEAQGYDLAYVSDMDVHRDPSLLTTAGLVVLLGHHEYWTTEIYDGMRNAQQAGVSMLINGSNIALWRVRFAPADTACRTVICYKESSTRDVSAGFTGTGYDPSSEWTGTWRDTTAANGKTNPDVRRENAATGQMFVLSAPVAQKMSVRFADKTKPVWRNAAAVQALTTGNTWQVPINNIGDEADSADGSGGQPTNLVNLNPTSISGTTGANAAGTIYNGSISPTVGITLHRHQSGALIANTGSWRGMNPLSRWRGSSLVTYSASTDVSVDWQNAALALLYDLGAAPTAVRSLRPGLDTTPTNPATGAPVGGRNEIAKAYGLTAGAAGGFFF
jgi:N,N-dimethylformamidase beta subunit-like protein